MGVLGLARWIHWERAGMEQAGVLTGAAYISTRTPKAAVMRMVSSRGWIRVQGGPGMGKVNCLYKNWYFYRGSPVRIELIVKGYLLRTCLVDTISPFRWISAMAAARVRTPRRR